MLMFIHSASYIITKCFDSRIRSMYFVTCEELPSSLHPTHDQRDPLSWQIYHHL